MTVGIENSRLVRYAMSNEVAQATNMEEKLRSLHVPDLLDQYREARDIAPCRGRDGLEYFVARRRRGVTGASSSMREDRLEMALVGEPAVLDVWGDRIDVLMRQFPLFSSGSRRGLRAVDLVGHGGGRFWLIELKVLASKGYGQTPLRALLECLIYCAVIEANIEDIRNELATKYGRDHRFERPGVIIAAPSGYWCKWHPNGTTGEWWGEYTRLLDGLSSGLRTPMAVIDLGDVTYVVDHAGHPLLVGELTSVPVAF